MKDWKTAVRSHYNWLRLRFMPDGAVVGLDESKPEQGWFVVMTPAELKKFIADRSK
jgi:hypothetical protein